MHTKYTEALALLNHLVVLNAGGNPDPDGTYRAFEDLTNYLNDNFPKPDRERDRVAVMAFLDATPILSASEILEYLNRIPPTFSEIVWTVAVMRFLVRDVFRGSELKYNKIYQDWALKYASVML